LQPQGPEHPPENGLVKKPKDLLEYVVIQETLHLIAPTHSELFPRADEQALPRMARGQVRIE
jgi:predicted metal-dependent hydrolase